jgi:hypothetical protein
VTAIGTVFVAGAVLVTVAAVVINGPLLGIVSRWLIFSKSAPMFTLGPGGVWFLANVLRLSPADFGEARIALFALFGSVVVAAFFKMRELLAIRGLAVLLLVCAKSMLDNVSGERIPMGLFFPSIAYAVVVFAMVIGTVPYTLRNALDFLLGPRGAAARVAIGTVLAACGLLLLFSAWTSWKS